MKPINVKSSTYIESSQEIINNILNLKLAILLEHQNIKKLQKAMFQIDLNETLRRGYMLLVLLMEKKLLERFMKKNCKNQVRKSLQLKK